MTRPALGSALCTIRHPLTNIMIELTVTVQRVIKNLVCNGHDTENGRCNDRSSHWRVGRVGVRLGACLGLIWGSHCSHSHATGGRWRPAWWVESELSNKLKMFITRYGYDALAFVYFQSF